LYRQYETVNLYRRGPGAKVELNRPERMNAWSRQFSADLRDAITEVTENPEGRAILITGAGRAFSSGADLKEAAEDAGGGTVDVQKILTERYHPLITGIRRMPQPGTAGGNRPPAALGGAPKAGHRRSQRPRGRDRALPRAGLRPGGSGRVRVLLARLRQHRAG